ncbi:MAG: MotA/TolQ/ExbB proton channel family protein [Proteobacteria bacterium]|nr:MotA/TolQ/ExbB proton channel family protein [Pseudomonadota bacterium]
MRGWKTIAAVALAAALATPAAAQQSREPTTAGLDELLKRVQAGWRAEQAENRKREADFKKARNRQQKLLRDAKATLARLERRSEALEGQFEVNERELATLETLLAERLGTLGELFGVVRQVAGDTAGHVTTSLVSAQLPGREAFLSELGQSKELPSIDKLERLWFSLQQEMTEQGKVVRFPATVLRNDGQEVQMEVSRIGVFNAVAGGKYLRWDTDSGVGKLAELGRQPASQYLSTIDDFEGSSNGLTGIAIDPSRGAILSLLVETPDAGERIAQGGVVGYTIIGLGLATGLLGLARLVYMLLVRRQVRAQQGSGRASNGNPLGRVLAVYESNKRLDAETLELKLDEAILKESSKLDRFLWLIKVVSVVAPLMGLLGTVTGMIQTFQAITLFGTGDPKLMAGGISEALVTTMLGLCVAIPLVLLHSIMSTASRSVTEVLEEQSAGIVAQRAEQEFTDGAPA